MSQCLSSIFQFRRDKGTVPLLTLRKISLEIIKLISLKISSEASLLGYQDLIYLILRVTIYFAANSCSTAKCSKFSPEQRQFCSSSLHLPLRRNKQIISNKMNYQFNYFPHHLAKNFWGLRPFQLAFYELIKIGKGEIQKLGTKFYILSLETAKRIKSLQLSNFMNGIKSALRVSFVCYQAFSFKRLEIFYSIRIRILRKEQREI